MKILIGIDSNTRETLIVETKGGGDMETIQTLASATISEAERIAKEHECDDKDCCAKLLSSEIADALKVTIDLHNRTHNHAR